LFTEIVSYPRPKIPSNLPKAKARPGSEVASAKSWPLTLRSPIWKTSFDTNPLSAPDP